MSQLEDKIAKLVQTKAINIQTMQSSRIKYRGSRILPLVRKEEPKGIVIEKDAAKKELILHLTYLCQEEEKVYINHLKCKGCIKDYDLKEEYSIFTYVGNFRTTTLGSEILAQVRSIVMRENQKYFEMTIKYQKPVGFNYQSPGITRDQVDIHQRDWKIYHKYGCFSSTFLSQFEEQFSNPGLSHRLSKDFKLKEGQSLNPTSLVSHLEAMSLDFQRVRQIQEKEWTDKHFMEGLKYLKAGKPEMALEHLTLAKSFDKKSSKIYIARGCALANLNNLGEGLKQIKEALRLSPNNKEAAQYMENIRKEMKSKGSKEFQAEAEAAEEGLKKVRVTNTMELIKK